MRNRVIRKPETITHTHIKLFMENIFTKNEDGEQVPLTVDDVGKIMANPFYCMNINPEMTAPHEPMITEEIWIEVAVKSIAEDGDGGRKFMRHLIENLKGNHVS